MSEETKRINIQPVVKYFGSDRHVLSQISEPIIDIDDEVRALIEKMANSLYFYNAVGISAIQLGVPKRIFLMRASQDKYATFINPEIIHQSDDKITEYEGCLSFPEVTVPVERSREIGIKFLEADGKEKELSFVGLHARCALHEVQHNDGKTFLDSISNIKKQIILDKMRKLERNDRLYLDKKIIAQMEDLAKLEVSKSEDAPDAKEST